MKNTIKNSIHRLTITVAIIIYSNALHAQEEASEDISTEQSPVPHLLRYPKALALINTQMRSFDPFGLPMNSGKSRIQMDPVEVSLEPEEEQNTDGLLQDALKKLSVTGIMPVSQSIILSGRFLPVGKNLNIHHEGILFRLRLDQVQSTHLVFTDMETSETVNHSLNILPRGREGLLKYGSRTLGLPSGATPINRGILIE